MPDERARSEITAAILAKLASGALPNVKITKVWAGKGTGEACYGCDASVTTSDVEIEVELSRAVILRLHPRCFRLWQEALGTDLPDAPGQ